MVAAVSHQSPACAVCPCPGATCLQGAWPGALTRIKVHMVSLEDIAPRTSFFFCLVCHPRPVLGRGPDHAGSNWSHSKSKSMVPWHELEEAEVTKQAKRLHAKWVQCNQAKAMMCPPSARRRAKCLLQNPM